MLAARRRTWFGHYSCTQCCLTTPAEVTHLRVPFPALMLQAAGFHLLHLLHLRHDRVQEFSPVTHLRAS
jgi:hypothetical protein